MVELFESQKKREDNLGKNKANLGIVSKLVRYVPLGGSLGIFSSFIKNQDWSSAIIVFPVIVVMIIWSAHSKDFLLYIQERINSKSRNAAVSLIQQVQKLNFRVANSKAEKTDFSGADLSGVDLSGVDLSGANLKYANLRGANLSGANFNCAEFRYADLSGADLRYADFSDANLKYANLSDANLNCTLLNGANLSDANLSGTLLFFTNLREVLNLEPFQLETKPSPFLCHVALPSYSQKPDINPNRACDRIPQLLSDRYNISLQEAQWIVDEARQHRWK